MLLKEQMLDDHGVSLWQFKSPIERLYEQAGSYPANFSVINAHCVLHAVWEAKRDMQFLGSWWWAICRFPAASCGAGTRTIWGAGRTRRAWTAQSDTTACGKYHSAILPACRVRSCLFFPWRALQIRRKELYCAPAPEERRNWLSTQEGSTQCQYTNCSENKVPPEQWKSGYVQ